MGDEAACTLHLDGATHQGKAYLETRELIFRGPLRLVLPLAEIGAATASEGRLVLRHGEREIEFEIGRVAERWAEKIRNPRGLIEKLGVKPGQVVALVGLRDAAFEGLLKARGVAYDRAAPAGCSVVFLAASSPGDLAAIGSLKDRLDQKGALWVVSPKGKAAALKDTEVIAAGRAAGLVDTKVVSFSESQTALRFVIPRDHR
jgi:hypothetical protein